MYQNVSERRADLSLVAADFRFFHTHTEPSAIGAHGVANPSTASLTLARLR